MACSYAFLVLLFLAWTTRAADVRVYHFLVNHWGVSSDGLQDCGPDLRCEWSYADHIARLKQYMASHQQAAQSSGSGGNSSSASSASSAVAANNGTITVAVYNIHSWWEKKREHRPAYCELRTNLSMVESEESRVRYNHLFEPSFKHFDGHSTTHPQSSVQRIYNEVRINASDFVDTYYNFSSLIKGASYVASDCHKRDAANANRDNVVGDIRRAGFRVDGLGRCMRSAEGPEGVTLPKSGDTRYNLLLKRKAISRYLFNLAFENSIESGYVTEKPFDALLSGTVPVYLGDAAHLKSLLPDKHAAIFIADFDNNATALVEYLQHLSHNETAYEVHRQWRKLFSYERNVRNRPLLEKSWYCRICEWAVKTAPLHRKRTTVCEKAENGEPAPPLNLATLNGRAIKSSGREVYFVQNASLHLIPDLPTFFGLDLELEKVLAISEAQLKSLPKGGPVPAKKSAD